MWSQMCTCVHCTNVDPDYDNIVMSQLQVVNSSENIALNFFLLNSIVKFIYSFIIYIYSSFHSDLSCSCLKSANLLLLSDGDDRDQRTVFVKNLPYSVTEDSLAPVFEGCTQVRLPLNEEGRPKG